MRVKEGASWDCGHRHMGGRGLPSDVYSLVNHHRVPKDLWERVQLLMQVHQDACPQPQSIPQTEYNVSIVNQQTHLAEFPQIDSSLPVPVFKQRDNPIDAINKIMVTDQPVKRRQSSFATGHVARQCPKPKRKKNATWFRDKVLLVEAQGSGDLDAYDSDCDDFSTAKAILMANFSSYGSDVLSETLMLEEESQSKMLLKQSDPMVLEKKFNIKPINYAELNRLSKDFGKRFVPQQEPSDEQAFRLQTSHPHTDQSASLPVKIETPRELPISLVNTSLKKLKYHLGQFDNVVKKRITPDALTKGEYGFEHTKAVFLKETIPFVNTLKDILKFFDKDLLNEEKVCHNIIKNDLRKFKGNDIVDNAAPVSNATTIAPGMYKLDPVTLALKKNNRKTHIYYLKHTMEQAVILREIFKQSKSLNPLDSASYSTCKYVKLIQELLGYVRDTCPDIHKPSEKLVAVTPINKNKIISKPKIAKYVISNKTEPGTSQGSKTSVAPSSSSPVDLRLSKLFCDLEVAFKKHTCFVRNMEGVDLLLGYQETNLYTLLIGDMMMSSSICLLSKASKIKSWLWHLRLSHLNFGAINHLAKNGLVRCLPKLKFEKDHLCSACSMGKSKKQSHKPKSIDTNQEKLYLMHMDLCGPMRVASINGKKYILVIMDDYSRFTWVKFLASKDEALDFIIKFLKMIQVKLNAPVRNIRTDNGTKFVNETLCYKSVGPLFLWAEAVATACYTQNRSIIRRRHGKTPYELLHDIKPNISYLHVFGALYYLNNDTEDLGKLQAKSNIGIFIGYAPKKKAYRINNRYEYFNPPTIVVSPVPVVVPPRAVDLADSLVSTIRRRRYNLIPAESKFKTPCSIIKDKYMMKAQVHVSKYSAISDVQALPQK
nr:retrovirus-related Pol polyprotein from transposon TNT 1-94 [Tanacetum cinerariifolium]